MKTFFTLAFIALVASGIELEKKDFDGKVNGKGEGLCENGENCFDLAQIETEKKDFGGKVNGKGTGLCKNGKNCLGLAQIEKP